MTGTVVVRFEKWGDVPTRVERWPVVAWLIEINQHDGAPSKHWAHPIAITVGGIINTFARKVDGEDFDYQMTCFEMGGTAGGRIWQFGERYKCSSLTEAQAYATRELTDNWVNADKAEKRVKAKRRKDLAQRAARRAQRLQSVNEPKANALSQGPLDNAALV